MTNSPNSSDSSAAMEEGMVEKKYCGFRVRQRANDQAVSFFVFAALPSEIVEWSTVDRLEEREGGFQRRLSDARVRAMQRFFTLDSRNVIPTSVVLAFSPGTTTFIKSDAAVESECGSSLPDTFDRLRWRWLKGNRYGEAVVQQLVQQGKAQLEEAQITAMPAMNDPQPAIALCQHPQVNDPQVGQTGGQQQAGEPGGIGQMALLEVKATAFLVGKERLDSEPFAIPPAGFRHELEVGHEIERFPVIAAPPDNHEHRAIRAAGHPHVRQPNVLAGRHIHIRQRQPLALTLDLDVLGGSADVAPAEARQFGLQVGAIKLAIAQKDDARLRWHQRLDHIEQRQMGRDIHMAFVLGDDQPGEGQGPSVVDEADDEGETTATNGTAVDHEDHGAVREALEQCLREGQSIALRSHAGIGQPALESLDTALALGGVGQFAGDGGEVGLAAADDATDQRGKGHEVARLPGGQRGWIELQQRVTYGTISSQAIAHG